MTSTSDHTITLDEYARRWLDTRDLRPRTLQLYRYLLDRRIVPTFGGAPLDRITIDAVGDWHHRITVDVSAMQAAKAYRLLRAILNTAVDGGMLDRSPCRIPGAGRERSPERPLAQPAEILDLVGAIDAPYRALVLLAATGGLRVGELLGLQRRHIDPVERTVRVDQQALELQDGSRIVTRPKTDAGRRTVAIPDVTVDALTEHLGRFTAASPTAWVFVGNHGGPLRRLTLQKAWTHARTMTGMTHITLHDLRHAGATLAAWTGASTSDLMARLGHSTPRAALRYQHTATVRDREIADRLGQFFVTPEVHGPETDRAGDRDRTGIISLEG